MSRRASFMQALGGAALVAWAVCAWREVDGAALLRALRGASPALLAVAALLNLAQVVPRAVLWSRLLRPTTAVPVVALARLHVVTLAVSNMGGARVGDLARVAILRVDRGVAPAVTLTVTVLEKGVGSLVLAAMCAPALGAAPGLPPWARSAALALVIAGLGILVVAAVAPRVLRRVRAAAGIVAASEVARQMWSLPSGAVLVSLVALDWFCSLAGLALSAQAAGIHAPWFAALLVILCVNAASLVPSTPAQLGVYEVAASAALQALGEPPERALAGAMLMHAAEAVLPTAAGFALGARGLLASARATRRERVG